MKIMVTGGAGFIGSHVVDGCLALGHDVVVVDDLSTGKREWINPRARFYQLDIRNASLDGIFAVERVEAVSHQAARANVRESMERPLLYADVNVNGSLNLLECCRRHKVRKFVYASTGGAVYGEPLSLPVNEDHAVNPLDPYGASKHFVEHYLYMYRLHFGLDYVVLRYPNVYGPRQDPYGEAGVVAIFAKQMLNGRRVLINGTGEQERDFVLVEDIVGANICALNWDGGGGIFNIGSGVGTSINSIFDHLARIIGYTGPREYGPQKSGEVYKIFLDASLARKELGWQPHVSLATGLANTVQFFAAEPK